MFQKKVSFFNKNNKKRFQKGKRSGRNFKGFNKLKKPTMTGNAVSPTLKKKNGKRKRQRKRNTSFTPNKKTLPNDSFNAAEAEQDNQDNIQSDSLEVPKENDPPVEKDISCIVLDDTIADISASNVDTEGPSVSPKLDVKNKSVLSGLQEQECILLQKSSNRLSSRRPAHNKWKDVKRRKLEEASVIECITIDSDSEKVEDDASTISVSDDEVQVIDSGSGLPDFIPMPKCVLDDKKVTKKKRKKSLPEEMGPLRPIVIDGANVAFGHSRASKKFSSEGLKICSDYFTKRGHKVYVFIPQFRRLHHLTTDPQLLDKMEEEGLIYYTPSRRVKGKLITSYDDRFIVEFASKKGAIIVTRDNYRDLINTNKEWQDTIEKRLLLFTFVDDMIMFPDDPLGRAGPSLDVFLRFPKSEADSQSSKS